MEFQFARDHFLAKQWVCLNLAKLLPVVAKPETARNKFRAMEFHFARNHFFDPATLRHETGFAILRHLSTNINIFAEKMQKI